MLAPQIEYQRATWRIVIGLPAVVPIHVEHTGQIHQVGVMACQARGTYILLHQGCCRDARQSAYGGNVALLAAWVKDEYGADVLRYVRVRHDA